MSQAIRIIGIDPGLRCTGWGVVESHRSRLSFVAAGTIRAPETLPLGERLCAIHDALEEVIRSLAPDEAAVEATFVNRDAAATLKLGQARGVAMLVPARAGIAVAEYAPNAVKKAVVGAGHAEKRQIRMMVSVLLPRANFDSTIPPTRSPSPSAMRITEARRRLGLRFSRLDSVSVLFYFLLCE